MTNLEYMRKHSYSEIIADTLDRYLGALYTTWYDEEYEEELDHLKWLFSERKETYGVQLPENTTSEIRGYDIPDGESRPETGKKRP